MSRRITIDPVTRLEGHGRIEIFLDDDGNVAEAFFQVPELRGFERFCVGRQAEEMPILTSRICGICPEAHHLASVKALDQLFGVKPPAAAIKIRELLYMAFFVADHSTHFYALGGPDIIIGPEAPAEERNLFGVIRKLGTATGQKIIACRERNHRVIKILGGRGIHPVAGLPGGWSKHVTRDEQVELAALARLNVEFARFTLQLFHSIVLNDTAWMELFNSDLYLHRTYSMGAVDDKNRPNFYDGKIRIVDPEGDEIANYLPSAYTEHIVERVEPWTYLKFPYLKKIGWQGFTDGIDSGVYVASPLSRLNVADGMGTPGAQEEYEKFFETLGSGRNESGRWKPVHHRLATHWARLIELLAAAERMEELADDPELTSRHVRNLPEGPCLKVGIGSLEAPRGTLTHHYETDERGVLTRVNLLVGTSNNHAAMAMSIKRAAQGLIRNGRVSPELLNRIEMAYRLYDPCLSCATHVLGQKPQAAVVIRSLDGSLLQTLGEAL